MGRCWASTAIWIHEDTEAIMKGCQRVSAILVTAALVLSAVPAHAGRSDALFSRKLFGLVSVGVSGICFKEAYDSRRDANDSYSKYKLASTSSLARELYEDSKRADTRTAVMAALGAGTLLYGIHLLVSDNAEDLPPVQMDRGLVQVKGVALDVTRDAVRGGLRVKLKKGF